MFARRGVAGAIVALAAIGLAAASSAARPGKPAAPRVVAAAMLDADRDARADGIRLAYSTRIRHAADRDGRYPFVVSGYQVRSVGAARGRALVILLVERAAPDPAVRPAVRYARTGSKPVFSAGGAQAAAQVFRRVQPHRRTPPPLTTTAPAAPATTAPTTTSAPAASPTSIDADGDGTVDEKDCAPKDATVHTGAPDLPDLRFVDANCDGIDGTEKDAIFVSPKGDDANPGTKGRPMRQIQSALVAALGSGKYVLAAVGSYARVTTRPHIDVYGGYDPDSWSRKDSLATAIVGSPEGLVVEGDEVTLQQLSISGTNAGGSAYGIRAINGAKVRLQHVTVSVGDGAPGPGGLDGGAGRPGSPGLDGATGACDHNVHAEGGDGGTSPVGRDGGKGGNGRYGARGQDGLPGIVGTPAGKGGGAGPGGGPGVPGGPYLGGWGQNGSDGGPGQQGPGGTNTTALALPAGWQGQGGRDGVYGAPGNGGGGGGGGGGQTGYFVIDGTGNAGGGGGGGGEGGRGGLGGRAGGGSFGVWLSSSQLVAEKSTIRAGSGGPGGRGGNGGAGGGGGKGGLSYSYCAGEIAAGGHGGGGGNGGQGAGGGGGAGGPSIGIFELGGAETRVTLADTQVTAARPGPGGGSGSGGVPAATAEAGIAAAIYPS